MTIDTLDPSEMVRRGLLLLRRAMSAFVYDHLKDRYKDRWWEDGVENFLPKETLKYVGDPQDLNQDKFQNLDSKALLEILYQKWRVIFQDVLGLDARDDVRALLEVRHRVAHEVDYSWEKAHLDIQRMTRFAKTLRAPEDKELEKLEIEVLERIKKQNRKEGQLQKDLGKLIDKHVKTEKGYEFHIYEVNDKQVKYDPVRTRNPGFHWSYISSIAQLKDKIPDEKRIPQSSTDIKELYRKLEIRADEGETEKYMFGILCAIEVIPIQDKAGRITECSNPNCPGKSHRKNPR